MFNISKSWHERNKAKDEAEEVKHRIELDNALEESFDVLYPLLKDGTIWRPQTSDEKRIAIGLEGKRYLQQYDKGGYILPERFDDRDRGNPYA